MRKTTFVSRLSVFLRIVLLGLISMPVIAQDAASTAAPAKEAPAVAMPKDPKELMLLAAKTNGLTGDDVKPWHLKASFTLLDENGKTTDQGTYEEFWVSEHKYKIAYTSAAFSQTNYGTEKGILRTGSRYSAPAFFTQVAGEFVNPFLANERMTERLSFDQQKRNQNGIKLNCLTEKGFSGSTTQQQSIGPTYCLEAEAPILLISAPWGGISQFVRNNIVSFQGRYLPRDLLGFHGVKLAIKVHLDLVEPLKTIDEAELTPPSDATPTQPTVTISSAEAQGLQLQQAEPNYPPIAKAAHVEGTVILQAILGKDGHVLTLIVIRGPAMLQQAALDGVRQWVYKPYLQNGEPVEVNTTIKVVFQLGRKPYAVP